MTGGGAEAVISLTGVTRRFGGSGGHQALDGVTADIHGPCIVGLLGRNGAGKTTLLRSLVGQDFVSSGTVRVLGANPVENDAVLRRTTLIREDQTYPDLKVRQALAAGALFHPRWDAALAAELLEAYELPPDRSIKKLSRGMRAALGIILGLAAHADVTLFDEPVAGLDAVVRDMFYRHLLADYTAHPRCIVLSTHLIDEVADLLERILILDHGRLVLDALTDDLRGNAVTVTGPTPGVERFVADRTTLSRRALAGRTTAVMAGRLDDRDRQLAEHLRLDLRPLTLQQLAMHAADSGSRATLSPAGTV
ncbi:ATP-binding cassette domain-containing protein [Streptomyces sp. NPDC021020]|uniref:ATP-binding cassette domain-containing protein n=1 Tax=Streptomyces sp. NPDC021020 TaxID=3365109 RepID=UPI0037A84D4F